MNPYLIKEFLDKCNGVVIIGVNDIEVLFDCSQKWTLKIKDDHNIVFDAHVGSDPKSLPLQRGIFNTNLIAYVRASH